MNPKRWENIKGLFDAALEIKSQKRDKFLKNACGDDGDLRREVENLLASFDSSDDFMEKPAVREVASLIVERKAKLKNGQKIAHYEILRQIGEGGMGEVYLAKDIKLNRKVALKVLPEHLTDDKSRLHRFEQEARAASALNHPNIITIHEIGVDKKVHFITTEFVEGETLRQRIVKNSGEISETLDIAVQIASALSVAHANNVIHRDIKPENVMIRPDRIVKLLDFGLAKLQEREKGRKGEGEKRSGNSQTANSPSPHLPISLSELKTAPGMVMGTVNYMSPEQAQGKQVNHRTDLWSLGVCLYEMLSGRLPFSGKTINHTLVAIMETKPLPLSQSNRFVPVELEHIITKLLAKEPKHRYQTANNLLADLRKLQKRIETEPHQAETKLFKATKIKQFSEEKPIEKSVREITSEIAAPNNLSGKFSPIIGREKEISEITNLLKGDSIRLLTLTGIGGTGKTRLAYEIAVEMLSEFVDGVFFIPLAAVRNAEFVASEIARPLGVKDAGGKSLLETLKDFLKEKQILLVVDNFEQILSAAPVLNELLANAPRLTMLVTSRALLHLRVEREFVVPPLRLPSDIAELSADDLLPYESVKLFMERAQAVKANLAATKENLQIIAEICSRLDGLPLAIELAAARVKILSPSAILTRLENSLKLLTGGAQDLPAHQQTMRGAIEWSFDLLEADEKILFRRLAVFTGGFTIEAAETVGSWQKAEGSQEQLINESVEQKSISNDNELLPTANRRLPTDFDILDGITSLVDKSLLVQKEQADGESRFRLLEVVREYALEILEASGEAEAIRKNHAAFFLAVAKEAEPHFFDEQGTNWLNRLEEEHDNLRAALSWSATSDAETAINLAAAMRTFWILHSHLTEGRKWLETALERSDDAPSALRFKLLHGLGQAAMYQGDTETARKMYEESLAVSKAAGDKRQIALSNRGLGALAKQQGDFTTARKFIEEGLKISRELNDKFGIAVSLNNLGDLARMEGDYAAARPLFEESLAISRQLGNKEGICGIHNNLAAITFGEDDFAAAHSHYAEALAMAQELGDKITVSYSLDGFAALAVKSGDTERAAQIASAAEHLRESLGFDTDPAERRFRDAISSNCKLPWTKKISPSFTSKDAPYH